MEDNMICPITKMIMSDPVILVETEITYEKEAISKWFASGKSTCPCTGVQLKSQIFIPNRQLRDVIEEYKKICPEKSPVMPQNCGSQGKQEISNIPCSSSSLHTTGQKYHRQSSDGITRAVKNLFDKLLCRSGVYAPAYGNELVEGYHGHHHPGREPPMSVLKSIMEAVSRADLITIERLGRDKWNFNKLNDAGHSPLQMAAMGLGEDGPAVVRLLILYGCAVDYADKDLYTPLHWAARRCHLGIMKVLIQAGANVNSLNINHITPLHLAAYHGGIDAVSLLLKSGANASIRNKKNERPIDYAMTSPKDTAKGVVIILKNLDNNTQHIRNGINHFPLV